MRRADTAVPLFDLDGKGDGVMQAKPAPCAAHAAFDGPQCLAIGMAAFEARIDQFFPDGREIADMCAEEIDPLPARDLRIEVVFFCHLAQYDQLVGRDLAAGYPRH